MTKYVHAHRFFRAALASVAALVVLTALSIRAGIKIDPGNMSPYSKTRVGGNLYTKNDPYATGGIRGTLTDAPSEVLGVLAMPQRFPNVSSLNDIEGGTSGQECP